jgi:Skp family chaperone for outer membrane proteins
MNTLMIFLIQTKTAATIEIIALLLVAAIIGYIVAYLYYKSVYTKIIKALESEKEQLNKQIAKLNEDIVNLKKNLQDKESQIESLAAEINDLKEHKSKSNS